MIKTITYFSIFLLALTITTCRKKTSVKVYNHALAESVANAPVDPDTGRETYTKECPTCPDPNQYRLGAVYVGYQNYQFGWNSEAIRHGIQNKWAHDGLQKGQAKWFKVLDSSYPGGPYGNYSPYYKHSLW